MIVGCLALAGCGVTPVSMLDGGPLPLRCAPPLRQMLVAPASGSNAGIPLAGVAWNGDHCELTPDEHDPAMVLLVADFMFAGAATLVASPANRWMIVGSSTGSGPTSYLSGFARDTDIRVDLDRGADAITIVFRVEAETLVLVSMARR